jgi:two-component system chemotaxis response regulator CheY
MRSLVVEDDFTSRLALQRQLERHGEAHIAVDGREAAEAFATMLEHGEPYDAVFLDIMMPVMNGHEALRAMRQAEQAKGIHVGQGARFIMTTALGDAENVMDAFRHEADAYLVKPVVREKLEAELKRVGLLQADAEK